MVSPDRRYRAGTVLLVSLVAALAALAVCGGAGPSATEVAVQWRKALEKGDYETTWDLEGPNLRDRAGRAAGIADRKKEGFGQPLSPERAAVSIDAVRSDQTIANSDQPGEVWVYLQVDTKDPAQSHLESVGLVRIGEDWRVQRREPSVPHVGWVR